MIGVILLFLHRESIDSLIVHVCHTLRVLYILLCIEGIVGTDGMIQRAAKI